MQKIRWFSAAKSSNILWLAAIVILAAALRIWLCSTDSYLHEWDERYHALVAKNLLLHPLKPTLYAVYTSKTPEIEFLRSAYSSDMVGIIDTAYPVFHRTNQGFFNQRN